MVSRYATASEPTGPAFVPIDPGQRSRNEQLWADENGQFLRIVTMALEQSYRRTPWHVAVLFRVRKMDFARVTMGIRVAGGIRTTLRVRISVAADLPSDKRIMLGYGPSYRPGAEPWGSAPGTLKHPPALSDQDWRALASEQRAIDASTASTASNTSDTVAPPGEEH